MSSAQTTATKAKAADGIKPIWSAHFDAPVNNVLATDDGVAFLCGDGTIRYLNFALEERTAKPHHAVILSAAAASAGRILTGGDDGRVVLTDNGNTTVLHEDESQWVNSVAASKDGSIAWSQGKRCYHGSSTGQVSAMECPTTPAALTFDPKGRRVAIALYGGAWLWLPKAKENLVRKLEWKGSHLGVSWSPDGAYVVTTMQEMELHGWRLKDGANMRMAGYPGKIHSISWNAAGTHLATSGAPAAVIWTFEGGGPMNQSPLEEGFLRAGIQRLSWHPTVDLLALGCAMGGVQLARPGYGILQTLREPGQHGMTGLAWARSGTWLVAGTAVGTAEIYAFGKE